VDLVDLLDQEDQVDQMDHQNRLHPWLLEFHPGQQYLEDQLDRVDQTNHFHHEDLVDLENLCRQLYQVHPWNLDYLGNQEDQ